MPIPPDVQDMKPTTLELDPQSEPLVTWSRLSYPAGAKKVLGSLGDEKVARYEEKSSSKSRSMCGWQRASSPDAARAQVKLSYQACDDRTCRVPAKLEIPLSVIRGTLRNRLVAEESS